MFDNNFCKYRNKSYEYFLRVINLYKCKLKNIKSSYSNKTKNKDNCLLFCIPYNFPLFFYNKNRVI